MEARGLEDGASMGGRGFVSIPASLPTNVSWVCLGSMVVTRKYGKVFIDNEMQLSQIHSTFLTLLQKDRCTRRLGDC